MTILPIGILGGTFDPIHLGHTYLAEVIYSLCYLQKIVLVPCHQSPFKKMPNTSIKDRLNMVQLASKNLPFLEIDDYEIKRPTISYTIQTLEYLRQKNGAIPLSLIIGTDSFNRFDEWYKWQKILEFAHLLIINRSGHEQIINKTAKAILIKRRIFNPEELQKNTAGLVYIADINPLPISATKVRKLIKKRKDASHMVTSEVWRYINYHKLYIN
jgi:nicotinate-nucleotide adenylyltransferase